MASRYVGAHPSDGVGLVRSSHTGVSSLLTRSSSSPNQTNVFTVLTNRPANHFGFTKLRSPTPTGHLTQNKKLALSQRPLFATGKSTHSEDLDISSASMQIPAL